MFVGSWTNILPDWILSTTSKSTLVGLYNLCPIQLLKYLVKHVSGADPGFQVRGTHLK